MVWERLSEIAAAGEAFLWAYCRDEQGCGHNARLDLGAIIARFGDMPVDRLRDRLQCPKCGKRARIVMTHSGRPG